MFFVGPTGPLGGRRHARRENGLNSSERRKQRDGGRPRFLRSAFTVDLTRGSVFERLVGPLLVVPMKIPDQSAIQFSDRFVAPNIDILVFEASPKPFDKHIVESPPAAHILIVRASV